MIQQILENRLQIYVSKQGGPDALLHFGRKRTESISAEIYFGSNGYWFTLEPTEDNKIMFTDEAFWWEISGPKSLGSGHFESRVHKGTGTGIDPYVWEAIKQWRVYHFHDTGDTSPLKQINQLSDNLYLRPDGRNIAAYLYLLKDKHPKEYNLIVKTVRLVAPFFNDFLLHPSPLNEDMIELAWTNRGLEWDGGEADIPFKVHQLSDGTLRFICLATVLLQPSDKQPETILIDEPELGLHPYAIKILAGLIRSVSQRKQIIISTQSTELVNEFELKDIVVVDIENGKSLFTRKSEEKLKEWLEEYSIGDLWKKNLLGGRPSR